MQFQRNDYDYHMHVSLTAAAFLIICQVVSVCRYLPKEISDLVQEMSDHFVGSLTDEN